MMTRILIPVVIAAFVSHEVLRAQNPTSAQAAPPAGKVAKIQCLEPTWKFGNAAQYTMLTHAFVIKNVGQDVLQIKQVVPSCQCQAVLPTKNELAPGEETTVECKMNTQGLQGPVTKTISVLSNDPTQGSIILTMTGDIVPPFSVKPRQIELGAVSKIDGKGGTELSFVVSKGLDVQLRDLKVSSPLVVATPLGKLEEQPDGTRILKVRVDLKGGASVGLLRETLTFITDMPNVPPAVVPVTASIEGEVMISPRTFNLGKVKKGETTSKEIEITKTGEANLVIEGVDVSPPGPFAAEVITDEAGKKFRVRVSVKADAPEGYQRGTLTLRTNCAGENTIQAYFYAFIGK